MSARSTRRFSRRRGGSALRRHGYNADLSPVLIDGVTLDVSALVVPVLDADARAVATRVQLVVGGDDVLLAAEHFNLLTWTTTGRLHRVSASVNGDAAMSAGEMSRSSDDGC